VHAYQPDRLKPASTRDGSFINDILCAHPALLGGAAMSVVMMAAIVTNAVWYQPGKHPAPLFSTRVATIETAKPVATKVKTVKTTSVKPTEKVATAEDAASREVLREVQTALSVRGYYGGKLDGLYGSRTRKAITAFQTDTNLDVDGKPSVRLLTQILMSASAQTDRVPLPTAPKIATVKTVPVQTVSLTSAAPQAVPADGLVARIQSGLKAYGYEELQVDGKMGQQTATAIQRFQLDYGMKITGEPSGDVLRKLTEIGAFQG